MGAEMVGIPLGWLYTNAGEWLIHKHVLHGLGKNRHSFWAFHWHEHHRESRRNTMKDPQYVRPLFRDWNAQTKEVAALLAGAALHVPLFPIAPYFIGSVWFFMWRYYWLHRKAHLDSEWAREHLPWHVDHHLGRNQNRNWCVTHPFFDYVMGTRQPYQGTSAEAADLAKRQAMSVPAARA
ncbi:MAG: hypothetical protein WBV82_11855 [Myxococcaceae bacterium]